MSRPDRRAVVIGGGFAGLSAAVDLADRGWKVTVVEKGRDLGGRARSFPDPNTGAPLDNGQHVFIGAYRATFRFLERLGTRGLVAMQSHLAVAFAEPGGRSSRIACPTLPSPFHLLGGAWRLATLNWRDRLTLLRMTAALGVRNGINDLTVTEWLDRHGQTDALKARVWHPLAVATLNDDPRLSAAALFATVLREGFLESGEAARIGIATVGLSDLYTAAARAVIEGSGGRVLVNSHAAAIEVESGRASGVLLRDGTRLPADAVISAVPHSALPSLLPERWAAHATFAALSRLEHAPILAIHLWLDRPVLDALFVGLIGTRVQWVFNRGRILGRAGEDGRFLNLVISGARQEIAWEPEKILSAAMEDLEACLPAARGAKILQSVILREPGATLAPAPGAAALRPEPRAPLPGLFLAGGWVRTDPILPDTIENAVRTGQACAALAQHLVTGTAGCGSHD